MASSRAKSEGAITLQRKRRPQRQRLLNRDFTLDINAPDESSLTEDQWAIADMLMNLEKAFFEAPLSAPRREALRRMQTEWVNGELGDANLRVLRAVEEVENVIRDLRKPPAPLPTGRKELRHGARKSKPRTRGKSSLSPQEKDAMHLICMVDTAFNGVVFGEPLDLSARLLNRPSLTDVLSKVAAATKRFGVASRNGGLAASGVLAVILGLAGVPSNGLVKRINTACTRAK